MSPNPQAPGYKEGIRLRKSTILQPTDFGQISLLIVKNRKLPRYRSPAIIVYLMHAGSQVILHVIYIELWPLWVDESKRRYAITKRRNDMTKRQTRPADESSWQDRQFAESTSENNESTRNIGLLKRRIAITKRRVKHFVQDLPSYNSFRQQKLASSLLVSVDHAVLNQSTGNDRSKWLPRLYGCEHTSAILVCFVFCVLPCKELDKLLGEIVILTNNIQLYKKLLAFWRVLWLFVITEKSDSPWSTSVSVNVVDAQSESRCIFSFTEFILTARWIRNISSTSQYWKRPRFNPNSILDLRSLKRSKFRELKHRRFWATDVNRN